jgi:hypothetical protein
MTKDTLVISFFSIRGGVMTAMNMAFLLVLFGFITIQIFSYFNEYAVSAAQIPPDVLLPSSSSSSSGSGGSSSGSSSSSNGSPTASGQSSSGGLSGSGAEESSPPELISPQNNDTTNQTSIVDVNSITSDSN